MALLTSYFDESGVHETGPCVVAGFVGNDAQWGAMIADWIPALKQRKNLHMRKLRWNQKPDKIASLLSTLGPIPHKYNLRPVVSAIKWSDFNAIARGKVDSQFANPYIMCAYCAISVVLLEVAADDEVYFLFDRQEGTRKETMDRMRDIIFEWIGVDRRVRGIDFMSRENTVCLDPADYLAYIVRERSLDMSSFKSQAGASIIGPGGNGGWISAQQLQILTDSWINGKRTIREMINELSTNPYFRGPL